MDPTPRKNPKIVIVSEDALNLIDIDHEEIWKNEKNHLILGGNVVPQMSKPIANCYCGY